MPNQKMLIKICQFIAQSYAIDPLKVIEQFEKTQSIDHVIDMAKNGAYDE